MRCSGVNTVIAEPDHLRKKNTARVSSLGHKHVCAAPCMGFPARENCCQQYLCWFVVILSFEFSSLIC